MPALTTSPSEVIYARVPGDLKADVRAYAASSGISVNSAVAALLDGGLLDAASNQDELEQQLREAEARVRALEANLADRGRALEVLAQEKSDLSAVAEDVLNRLDRPVGTCPSCSAQVTGRDVLMASTCAACGASLVSLLAPERTHLSQGDYLLLMGALAILLALVLWQSKQTA